MNQERVKVQYLNKVLLAIVFTSAVLGIMRINSFPVGAYVDDAHYVILAESLASGQGYRLINFPQKPPQIHFPAGWPLILAPFAHLLTGNYMALKLISFVFWLGSIALVYRLFSVRIKSPYLELLTALIALNPMLVGCSGMLMSESAYLFFSLLTLTLFEYWKSKHQELTKTIDWLLVLLAISAFYTQLIRELGSALVLAIAIYLLLSKSIRQLGSYMAIIALGMALQTWFNSQGGGSIFSAAHEQFIRSFVSRLSWIMPNLGIYFNEAVSNVVVPVFGPNVAAVLARLGLDIMPSILNMLILCTIMLGAVISYHDFTLGDLYVSIYVIALILIFNPNFDQWISFTRARYLIPIVPFLYFYMIRGAFWFFRLIVRKNDRCVKTMLIATCSLIMLFSLARNIQSWLNPIRNRITDLSVGTTWIAENTPPESIILARDPIPDYLYTRRRTACYPSGHQKIKEFITNNKVNYVMISPKLQMPVTHELDHYTKGTLLPYITSNPGNFQLVYNNSTHNVSVYKVLQTTDALK